MGTKAGFKIRKTQKHASSVHRYQALFLYPERSSPQAQLPRSSLLESGDRGGGARGPFVPLLPREEFFAHLTRRPSLIRNS